jgi:hypothetical protein
LFINHLWRRSEADPCFSNHQRRTFNNFAAPNRPVQPTCADLGMEMRVICPPLIEVTRPCMLLTEKHILELQIDNSDPYS